MRLSLKKQMAFGFLFTGIEPAQISIMPQLTDHVQAMFHNAIKNLRCGFARLDI
jgi:hypothetical protein